MNLISDMGRCRQRYNPPCFRRVSTRSRSHGSSGIKTLLAKCEADVSPTPALLLLGDNPVRPLDQRHEDRWTAEFCSPVLQVCFRDPTGTGTGTSGEDRDVLGYDFVPHFGKGWPSHRKYGCSRNVAHEVGCFSGKENLHLVTRVGQRQPMGKDERCPRRIIRPPGTLHHDLQRLTFRCYLPIG